MDGKKLKKRMVTWLWAFSRWRYLRQNQALRYHLLQGRQGLLMMYAIQYFHTLLHSVESLNSTASPTITQLL